LPELPTARKRNAEVNGRFLINREDGKLMGVAAGLADWTGVDVMLVRLGLVAALLLTGPVIILFYLLTGWLASKR
jgi:phage shock protein C